MCGGGGVRAAVLVGEVVGSSWWVVGSSWWVVGNG